MRPPHEVERFNESYKPSEISVRKSSLYKSHVLKKSVLDNIGAGGSVKN
jgi:hypothetical protein